MLTTHPTIDLVDRTVLVSNRGRYGVPDEQLHFPWLYESHNGIWYMTYREGPHLEEVFGAGNRVQCVQTLDRGRSWIPWMGLKAQPWMYQLFVTRMPDRTLIGYRCKMTDLQPEPGGTVRGTAVVLRSSDEGATWTHSTAPVYGLPFTRGNQLVSLWGHAVYTRDGRLLWPIYSREGNTISGLVTSADRGRSFRWLAELCPDESVGERREPGLARTRSGDLLVVLRCGTDPAHPVVAVRSSDDGETWSPPRSLKHAGVCPQLLLLRNGALVCSYGTRRYLHVIADLLGEGDEWTDPLVLYQGQTDGYSCLQATGEDRFRIVYQEGTFDAFQTGGNRIVRTEMRVRA